MRSLFVLVVFILSATFSAASLACGVCIEDKVAATYEHAVVMKAGTLHHLVVFGEIEGAVDMNVVTASLPAAAKRVHGIDRGTLRTSQSPPAFSFALDPTAQTPSAAVADLQKRLRMQGVKLSVLRVMSSQGKAARN
jgi:hypothetical protein